MSPSIIAVDVACLVISSHTVPHGDALNAHSFEANVRALIFFFENIASGSSSQDNMLTRVFSSTIRTVLGSQFVREKLSIALLF